MDQTIAQAEKFIDTGLSGLASLPVQLAIIVVLMAGLGLIIWLILRPYLRREQIASDAITRIADAADHRVKLERLVGKLELQLNELSNEFTLAQNRMEKERLADKEKYDAERKMMQAALDEANKKLDDLKAAAEQQRSLAEQEKAKLLEQNQFLTEQVEKLTARVKDLQFQLNQFLKLPEVQSNEASHTDSDIPADL